MWHVPRNAKKHCLQGKKRHFQNSVFGIEELKNKALQMMNQEMKNLLIMSKNQPTSCRLVHLN